MFCVLIEHNWLPNSRPHGRHDYVVNGTLNELSGEVCPMVFVSEDDAEACRIWQRSREHYLDAGESAPPTVRVVPYQELPAKILRSEAFKGNYLLVQPGQKWHHC